MSAPIRSSDITLAMSIDSLGKEIEKFPQQVEKNGGAKFLDSKAMGKLAELSGRVKAAGAVVVDIPSGAIGKRIEGQLRKNFQEIQLEYATLAASIAEKVLLKRQGKTSMSIREKMSKIFDAIFAQVAKLKFIPNKGKQAITKMSLEDKLKVLQKEIDVRKKALDELRGVKIGVVKDEHREAMDKFMNVKTPQKYRKFSYEQMVEKKARYEAKLGKAALQTQTQAPVATPLPPTRPPRPARPPVVSSPAESVVGEPSSGSTLTHMTKGRARKPRKGEAKGTKGVVTQVDKPAIESSKAPVARIGVPASASAGMHRVVSELQSKLPKRVE